MRARRQAASTWLRDWLVTTCLAVVLVLSAAPEARAQDEVVVFRDRTELSVVHVHVAGRRAGPLPTLDAAAFSIRIGRRTPPIRLIEQVPLPTEEARGTAVFRFFRPVRDRESAVYLLGIDPDEADCRQSPRVTVSADPVRVRGWMWSPKPGCLPPRARIEAK